MYTVHINDGAFEWDPKKDRKNRAKHGVAFDEATTVFLDDNAVRFFDPDHSDVEERFILLGMSARTRILVVCHCFRWDGGVIRIISARKANATESKNYPGVNR